MDNTVIDNVAESITNNILSSNIIDKETVKLNIKIALTALQPSVAQVAQEKTHIKGDSIQLNNNTMFENMAAKLRKRKIQAKKDAFEKNYWKSIIKEISGEEGIQKHYKIMNKEIVKLFGNDIQSSQEE